MQQKVAVAAALIADPPILLLDEPTIGLDVEAARTVKDWIVRLAREQGKTVVLTTHQLDMAQELCDRVAIMRAGCVAADMPVQDLLRRFRQDRYRIALGTWTDLTGVPLPEGLTTSHEDGATILTASNLDSPGLYSLMSQLNQLGLPLRSVSPVEPDLEDAFLELVRAGTTDG
ncbi:MAG TPA: ABC transporter ATP-binding protein [Candidatus Dormibacteraeota bacterium]|nr:ABC transporter ATP-binding protein [Candidatus Dormibacteraeota bacterium]